MPSFSQNPHAVNDNRPEAVDNAYVYEASRRIIRGISFLTLILSGSAAALAYQSDGWQSGAIFGFFSFWAASSAFMLVITGRQ